jgi:class 3 adenylate cyclase/HAMP domain-containing protein
VVSVKPLRLCTRLSLSIIPVAAFVYLAALAYNHHLSRQALLQDLIQDARNISQGTAEKIARVLQGVEKVPRSLAVFLEEDFPMSGDLSRLLSGTLTENPEIFGMAVAFEPYSSGSARLYYAPYVHRRDDRLKSTILGSPQYHYFSMEWYRIPRETGRPHWSKPYFDEGGGDIIMSTYSVPFYHKDKGGKRVFKGVVTADLSLMGLMEVVSRVKIYQSGYAFVISQDGTFVTFPDKSYIMRESIFRLAAAQNRPGLQEVAGRMIKGEQDLVVLRDLVADRRVWLAFTPLGSTGWSLGVVFPEDELLADLIKLSHKLLLMGLAGLVLLGVVLIGLSRTITRPLSQLAQSTAIVARGDFSFRIPETGAREIAQLAGSFNRMGEELLNYIAKRDFIRDTFGRYVTQEVVKKLLEDEGALALGGEAREVTILMSDLRGFTALTADLSPERIISLLNRYLGKMIEILMDFQAVIDEIQGDGLLAFFGAPSHQPDHHVRAVACALTMQLAMEEVNAANIRDGFPPLEMGIGVSSGTVVVGNIGSERRTKYSVVGSPVNFTSRIEALATPGQVLISRDTFQRVQEWVELGEVLEVDMKGIPGRVSLYEIRGLKGPYQLRLSPRRQTLVPLLKPLPVRLDRLQDKVVVMTLSDARLTHLSETAALVASSGGLVEWEDVRLFLPDSGGVFPTAPRIYAKVTALKGTETGIQAELRFTSVSPAAREALQKILRDSERPDSD